MKLSEIAEKVGVHITDVNEKLVRLARTNGKITGEQEEIFLAVLREEKKGRG